MPDNTLPPIWRVVPKGGWYQVRKGEVAIPRKFYLYSNAQRKCFELLQEDCQQQAEEIERLKEKLEQSWSDHAL